MSQLRRGCLLCRMGKACIIPTDAGEYVFFLGFGCLLTLASQPLLFGLHLLTPPSLSFELGIHR